MPIKTYKPTSPGMRFKKVVDYSHLDNVKPLKSKTRRLKRKAGRSKGKITVRHKGGGHKRLYREIDFVRRDKEGVAARVAALEYDPNRSAFIARLHYADGDKRYMLAPDGLKKGDEVMYGEKAPVRVGNAMPLGKMPQGTVVYNIELQPGKGGQIVRSAGESAVIMSHEGKYSLLKLPSGERRLFLSSCSATIGQVSNPDYKLVKLGKAGRSRHMGIRPSVRGVAMPAGEHPHGGGEGRTGTGRNPRTVYGKPAYGKTRKRKKKSNRLIVKKRK
ncbi:50S ribosomal protein L2 [candidate division CPR3 bacterium 4484_211]|uniref:Large ribosomal subunit protein uL2 n=1 Tax=candidate division CPR3 bacterium 4484_211 TaxID=1968527 RepID=A0A1W9NZD5_UNCC3|nr:MAG: 50S ribosomal protein L2 [candidate division CPR3 bacterium 4484_211]